MSARSQLQWRLGGTLGRLQCARAIVFGAAVDLTTDIPAPTRRRLEQIGLDLESLIAEIRPTLTAPVKETP